MIAALTLAAVLAASGGSESKYDPAQVGLRIMRHFLSTEPCDYKPVGYDGEAYGKGQWLPYAAASWWANGFDFARLTGNDALAVELARRFEPYREGGKYACSIRRMHHVDDAIAGVVPLAIYLSNGDEDMRRLGLVYADTQWTPPCEKSLKERHAAPKEVQEKYWCEGYTPQTRLWIDDMYMIIALQTMACRATGDRKYVDRAAKEMCFYLDELQLKDGDVKGLFYHAPDVPYIWGRGDGWMAAGMALVLTHLDESSPYRAKILRGYRDMMAALLLFQRPDGLWGQLVNDSGIWAETSGSAMFTYAFLTGVRQGWLDWTSYGAAAEKAWRALCDRLDEHANLADVCIGTGKQNDHQYYVDRRRINGDPHGEAPMMWCVNELLRSRDDTARLQRGIDANPSGVLPVPAGVYRISSPLVVTNLCSLELHKDAILRAVKPMPYVLRVDVAPAFARLPRSSDRRQDCGLFIRGGRIDGDGLASCLALDGFCHFTLRDMTFLNGKVCGLRVNGISDGYELIADNLYFKCVKPGLSGNAAVHTDGGDSHYTDCVSVNYTVGFRLSKRGANRLTRCHVWGSAPEALKDSVAFWIDGGSGNILRDCYADTAQTGFLVDGPCNRLLGCSYHNNARFGLDDITIVRHPRGKLYVADGSFGKPSPRSKVYEGCGEVVWSNMMYSGFAPDEDRPGALEYGGAK